MLVRRQVVHPSCAKQLSHFFSRNGPTLFLGYLREKKTEGISYIRGILGKILRNIVKDIVVKACGICGFAHKGILYTLGKLSKTLGIKWLDFHSEKIG